MFESDSGVSLLETARTALRSAERRVGVRHRSEVLAPVPQHPEPLTGLLPGGVLPVGAAAVVRDSAGLLGWLVGATQHGKWLAIVGWPALGMVALAEAGVDLERTFLVPDAGGQAAAVLAALLGGIDVVVVGPGAQLTEAEQRRLLTRARQHGSTILSPQAWPGATLRLHVEHATRAGMDQGNGYLREAQLSVVRSSAADGPGRRFTIDRDRDRVIAVQAHTWASAARTAVG
ncbi:hypothetical protein C8K30_115111 [Promicromonospora sp. AC04]|uniref:hypothetical protein n=1 Tax=Promicromonospora sp. AC04 TaxID=2135723 RepID=UPI000D385FF4|nr:hypothetical protein [Promicromonospora sp. AC04]PUB20900.1 hypothetical protein C8K30_115111 [Promicromonospora sp. AC04]